MKATKQNKREAKELFRFCLQDGVLDPERAQQVVERLSSEGRRDSVAVISGLHRLVRLDSARHDAKVESAEALPADLRASVQSSLTQAYGPGLNISFSQDASLIGGMRIRVGSDVYDESVKARLAALEESF